jgi:NitT/TauT family transport system substrate-binding protein
MITRRFAGVIALALSLACSQVQAQTRIKIGQTGVIEALVYFVAIEKGFFKSHGIDAEQQLLPNNSVLVPAIVSGEVQLGAVLVPVLIQAVDAGLPIAAAGGIGIITPESKGIAIIARKGSGIKTARDLIGKRLLAGNLSSLPTIIAKQWLRSQGVDPGKVTFVEVPMAQAGDVLRSGRADAAVSPEPLLSGILRGGTADVLKYAGQIVPDKTETVVSVVSTDWATKNPGALAAIRASIDESLIWSKAHQDEAMQIAAKYLDIKPELTKYYAFPDLDETLPDSRIQWWIDALKADNLLRTDIKPSQVILP